MLRLHVLGPDSVLESSTCARCPHSPAGCCVAPPRYDWSDLGRVVAHGGLEWLLARWEAGDVFRVERGMAIRRRKGRLSADPGAPRLAKCSFHDGARGCTIRTEMRPATCNFYLCESALDAGTHAKQDAEVAEARRVHDALVRDFVAWDAQLDREMQAHAEPLPMAELLAWLGQRFVELRATGATAEPGRT